MGQKRWKHMCLCTSAVLCVTVVWFMTQRPLTYPVRNPAPMSRFSEKKILDSPPPDRSKHEKDKKPESLRTIQHACAYTTTTTNLVLNFLAVCGDLGLDTLLVEPALLKKIETDMNNPCFWPQKVTGPVVTFGVIDPSDKALEWLSEAFDNKMPHHQVIHAADPRNVSASSFTNNKTLPRILMHFLWWSRDEDDAHSLLLHLVVFRSRGDYLWHSELSPSLEKNAGSKLQFPLSNLSIGQHAALVDRFATRKRNIGGVSVSLPVNISSFLQDLQESKLVECNHEKARGLVAHVPTISNAGKQFREKVLKTLRIAKKTLDDLGITFWLGSGTFLGWYRHCDVIPYTSDVDIEMRIGDYTPTIPKALEAAGLPLIRQLGKLTDSFELTFKREVNMDIFFFFEEKNHTWFGMFDTRTYKKYRLIFPKFSLRWVEFGGLKLRIPYPPEAYLKAHYGKTWAEPNKAYSSLKSPPNRVFAGVWPPNERAGLRHIYHPKG